MQPTLHEKEAPTVKIARISASGIPLSQTLQFIFNEHKETGGPLVWTAQSLMPDAPGDLQQAKDSLIQKGIISTHPDSPIITILNSEYRSCGSYDEAELVWKQNHRTKAGTTEKIFKYAGIIIVAAALIFVAVRVLSSK